MSRILLLDFDHTFYPSTLPTLHAVDARITRYIELNLGLTGAEANALRLQLCARFGTTLKGLEVLHGVDRERYCDFVHALDAAALPPPDPRLRRWLQGLAHPAYVFTNARRDWAERCLASMQMEDLLKEGTETAVLRGILDIAFLGWTGKPEPSAFEAAERFVRGRHPEVTQIVFADDRLDNLETARARGWITVWVRPHTSVPGEGAGHHVVDSLPDLLPDALP